jgi:hypothetical protein
MALAGRAAAADEEVGKDGRSAGPADRVAEQGGLVVAADEKPRPMQRNREGGVGVAQQFGAGAGPLPIKTSVPTPHSAAPRAFVAQKLYTTVTHNSRLEGGKLPK